MVEYTLNYSIKITGKIIEDTKDTLEKKNNNLILPSLKNSNLFGKKHGIKKE